MARSWLLALSSRLADRRAPGSPRLNADGTVDTAFNPGANGAVYCVAIQPDGKILVGGSFTILAGQACTRLGRLNPDGTLDGTFSAPANGAVYCLALQTDGQILAGGSFTSLGGETCNRLGRLQQTAASTQVSGQTQITRSIA